jgi:spore coat protein U-like protein
MFQARRNLLQAWMANGERSVGLRRPASLLLVAAAVLLGGSAEAAPQCKNLSVAPLLFGAYDVFSPAALRSTTNVLYSCPPPIEPPRVSLSRGGSSSYRPRQLAQGAERLSYNLYLDAACSQIWGDGSEGTQTVNLPEGNNRTWPIYACIPPQQDVAIGTFSDVVVVTFDF